MSNRQPGRMRMLRTRLPEEVALRDAMTFRGVWRARIRRAWMLLIALLARKRQRTIETALYLQLSGLSEAELERRGFGRGDLYRHVRSSLDQ